MVPSASSHLGAIHVIRHAIFSASAAKFGAKRFNGQPFFYRVKSGLVVRGDNPFNS